MRRIVLLGSTGSIGTQTLDVTGSRPDRFDVVGLAASGGDVDLLAGQVVRFRLSYVALTQADKTADLERELMTRGVEAPQLLTDPGAMAELAVLGCGVVVNAVARATGLEPTLAALGASLILALANKKSLVIGGRLVANLAVPGQLVTVDSEHSAFTQALHGGHRHEVARLILVAPGGPFRGHSREEPADVTPEEAMARPAQKMDQTITINSSTLVNKGLELIGAALLHDVGLDDIVVAVHPQSVVHSMVEFTDRSTLAQASPPDMRLPIGLAPTWPDRLPGAVVPCDQTGSATWTFELLNNATPPAVELARRAGEAAGTAPAVYNAANEVLVDAFCGHKIGFLGIANLIS